MDELENAAVSYDFAKGFFQPTSTELMGSSISKIHNFGILLSTLLQKKLVIDDWNGEKFDPVSYFVHFFLGVAFSSQHSGKMRDDLKIKKIFWHREGTDKLKMYVTVEDGPKKKLMMKCIDFTGISPDKKYHDWSDDDFLGIISKIGSDIKSYDIESHHYDLNFVTKRKSGDSTGFEGHVHAQAHYDQTIKIKPSLIKRGHGKSTSKLNEIKPIEGEKTVMEDHLSGMLSRPEEQRLVKTSAKDFASHVIQNFKTHSDFGSSEAQAGFMHGSLLPFQKKYDFHVLVVQSTDRGVPDGQYDLSLIKKFTAAYKRLLPDYPVSFHIVDTHMHMNPTQMERRAFEVMVQYKNMRLFMPEKTLSDKALITYVNFNAQKSTLAQNDVPTLPTIQIRFRETFAHMAKLLQRGDAESLREVNEFKHNLALEIFNMILINKLKEEELSVENSRCLTNYLYGVLSTDAESAYLVKQKLDTGVEESFMLETESRNLQIWLRVYESDQAHENIKIDNRIVPSLNKNSKSIAVISIVRQLAPDLKNIEIHTSIEEVKHSKKFQIQQISKLSVAHEIAHLSSNVKPPRSPDKIFQFFKDKGNQFRNFDEFGAFVMGCFHDVRIYPNIMRLSSKTMHIAYKIESDRTIVLANFMFGEQKQSARALAALVKFHSGAERHTVAGKQFIVTIVSDDNPVAEDRKMHLYNEEHLSMVNTCTRMNRLKRTTCSYNEDVKQLEEHLKEEPKKVQTKKLTFEGRVRFFKTLGTISHSVMTGLMVKSLIADLAEGNWWGVAINVGFVLANIGTSYASSRLMTKAATLTEEGRVFLGSALKAGAPFLARSASFLFVGYDLYSNLHSNDTSIENKVATDSDIAYLSLDLAETSIEIAEAVGAIEGIAATGGPILWAVGAAVMVGADIFRAVKQVERIMATVNLTSAERVLEGLRGFIGLGPSRRVTDKLALQANTNRVGKLLASIHGNKQIKRYITPLQSSQSCSWDKYIDLTASVRRFPLSTATPSLPDGFSYFCSMSDHNECNVSEFLSWIFTFLNPFSNHNRVTSHMCAGAAGIINMRNKRAEHTYYELTDGRDYVRASENQANIFELGNGEKEVYGGDEDDIFLLIGKESKGHLDGKAGSNLLNLGQYKFNGTMKITENSLININSIQQPEEMVRISNFDQIYGRPDLTDHITVWCSLAKVNMFGGLNHHSRDNILIPSTPMCLHNLTMVISPNTIVNNEGSPGHFHYHVQETGSGRSKIILINKDATAKHIITFENNFFDFSSIHTHLYSHPKVVIFRIDNKTVLTVEAYSLHNVKIAFKDRVHMHLHNKHLVASLLTTQSLEEVENFYADTVSASTVHMIIHSTLSNETLTLSRGRHHRGDNRQSVNIHHSDADGKSHLKGNEHQNIFAISPHFTNNTKCVKFHEVSISVKGDSKNLVDFTSIRRAAAEISFTLSMINENSLVIHAHYTKEVSDLQCERDIGQVKIHMINSTRNVVLMNKGPLRLKFKDDHRPYLESPPIYFNKSQHVIILSDYDTEESTEIFIDKHLGEQYRVLTYNDTILLTNVPSSNDYCEILDRISEDSVAILIIGYSSSSALQSLIIKFNDVTMSMRDNLMKPNPAAEWKAPIRNFDFMACIWRAIAELPVSPIPTMKLDHGRNELHPWNDEPNIQYEDDEESGTTLGPNAGNVSDDL